MTIEELYQWAKNNNAADYCLGFVNMGLTQYIVRPSFEELDIDNEKQEVIILP